MSRGRLRPVVTDSERLPDSTTDRPSNYRTRYDRDGPEELTTTLVTALATLEGVPPTKLPFCLADTVDVDAMVRVLALEDDRHGAELVRFEVDRYAVIVRRSGEIEISAGTRASLAPR